MGAAILFSRSHGCFAGHIAVEKVARQMGLAMRLGRRPGKAPLTFMTPAVRTLRG
jgi:hypothetical protein